MIFVTTIGSVCRSPNIESDTAIFYWLSIITVQNSEPLAQYAQVDHHLIDKVQFTIGPLDALGH